MPGENLVNGVVRRPDGIAFAEAVEKSFGKRAQVAVGKFLLALGEFRDHLVAALLERIVAGSGVSKRARGEVMAANQMPAKFAVGLFPSTERLSLGCQAGI